MQERLGEGCREGEGEGEGLECEGARRLDRFLGGGRGVRWLASEGAGSGLGWGVMIWTEDEEEGEDSRSMLSQGGSAIEK